MSSNIRFQNDGADKIYNALFGGESSADRYLLADEVGLGKTITAAKVISKLCRGMLPHTDVNVGYICSNAALAKANIRKLKKTIRDIDPSVIIDEKNSERVSLGFLNRSAQNGGSLHIHIVTPSTTIRIDSDGTVEERAAAYIILCAEQRDEKPFLVRDSLLISVCADKASDEKLAKELKKAWNPVMLSSVTELRRLADNEWRKKRAAVVGKFIEEAIRGISVHDERARYTAAAIMKKLITDGVTGAIKKTDGIEPVGGATNPKTAVSHKKYKKIRKKIILIRRIASYRLRSKADYLNEITEILLQEKKRGLLKACLNRIIGENGDFLSAWTRETLNYTAQALTPLIAAYMPGENVMEKTAAKFREICCREMIKILRSCMIIFSVKNKMDLYLADEIQNYSELLDIVRKDEQSRRGRSEMSAVIREIIGTDEEGRRSKLLLMSATPFRFRSKKSELTANTAAEETDGAPLSDKEKFMEKRSDVYREFQMIIQFLKPDFDFEAWKNHEKAKRAAVGRGDRDAYKAAAREQSNMLKNANISRVERYMSGFRNAITSAPAAVPADRVLWEELRGVPRATVRLISTADVIGTVRSAEAEQKDLTDMRIILVFVGGAEHMLLLSGSGLSEIADTYFLIDAFEFEYLDEALFCEDRDCEEDMVWQYAGNNQWEWTEPDPVLIGRAKRLLEAPAAFRISFMKSTPAFLSFSSEYKSVLGKDDSGINHRLSGERVINYEQLFALNERDCGQDGMLYNARLAALFRQVFDIEEQHKLLFIPPSAACTLAGAFRGRHGVSKRLFFTDLIMTPRSLSALLTHEAERRAVQDLKKRLQSFRGMKLINAANSKTADIDALCRYDDDYGLQHCAVEMSAHDKAFGQGRKGSPHHFTARRPELFGGQDDAEDFCRAFFRYMLRSSSLRTILAYTDIIGGGSVYDYILKYCEDGNIGAVLNEYAELYVKNTGTESFAKAFMLAAAAPSPIYAGADGYRMHTGFAFGNYDESFGQGKAKAFFNKVHIFNSPLRPFNFISTSIGQEGFDFHYYCRKIVHWSLECDPIKFEQREGRINRFRCYANRLSAAAALKKRGAKRKRITLADWDKAFNTVKKSNPKTARKARGLFPDFVIEHNRKFGIEREFYYYPGSFEEKHLPYVLKAIGYYRSLLGQYVDDTYEETFTEFMEKVPDSQKKAYFIELYPS